MGMVIDPGAGEMSRMIRYLYNAIENLNRKTIMPMTGSAVSTPAISNTIDFIADGGGLTLLTGSKGYLVVDFPCTIQGFTLLADQTGSIVMDVKKSTYAAFPSTASITGSVQPTLATGVKNQLQSTSLTGWTLSISAGDILEYVVTSVTTIQRVLLSLKVIR